jgi:hypothetical protein
MKAFPTSIDNGHISNQDGMNLRDYFAAKAMQTILANDATDEVAEEHGESTAIFVAQLSYAMADAMMEERDL